MHCMCSHYSDYKCWSHYSDLIHPGGRWRERARFYEGEERSTLNREKGCPKGQIGKERKKEKKENKEIF